MKKRIVVVCPGRGTYTKESLGYLTRYHSDKHELFSQMDDYRKQSGQTPLTELDNAENFKANQHVTGDNASALIYACAMADFFSIDQDKFEIVAVTGNSMGWYLALACAQAVSVENGLNIVNTMGTTMHKEGPGGQVIFPLCDENWQISTELEDQLEQTRHHLAGDNIEVYDSIYLGGMRVLAASTNGVRQLLNTLPKVQDRYPFALVKHGAFHSPLMQDISLNALRNMEKDVFTTPKVPLVDGRGHIWKHYPVNASTQVEAMFHYTFGHQVVQPYDYSKAVDVSVKEFAPDHIVILGPGSTLGAPTAQQLIAMQWLGLTNKQQFKTLQQQNPFILSMGIDEQRKLILT